LHYLAAVWEGQKRRESAAFPLKMACLRIPSKKPAKIGHFRVFSLYFVPGLPV
jgi:hypothetical protein